MRTVAGDRKNFIMNMKFMDAKDLKLTMTRNVLQLATNNWMNEKISAKMTVEGACIQKTMIRPSDNMYRPLCAVIDLEEQESAMVRVKSWTDASNP